MIVILVDSVEDKVVLHWVHGARVEEPLEYIAGVLSLRPMNSFHRDGLGKPSHEVRLHESNIFAGSAFHRGTVPAVQGLFREQGRGVLGNGQAAALCQAR
jgi:hypothetical protein